MEPLVDPFGFRVADDTASNTGSGGECFALRWIEYAHDNVPRTCWNSAHPQARLQALEPHDESLLFRRRQSPAEVLLE